MRTRSGALAVALPLAAALLAAACSSSSPSSAAGGSSTAAAASTAKITAIGAENEYADVISQVGGKYVQASSIMSNPNTDPHTFEASPAVAREITAAKLIVQNGVGYDDWATTIENADPSDSRQVINVQQLLKLPDSTPEPAPVVQPRHDARGCQRDRGRPRADRPRARLVLQGQRGLVHRQPERVE